MFESDDYGCESILKFVDPYPIREKAYGYKVIFYSYEYKCFGSVIAMAALELAVISWLSSLRFYCIGHIQCSFHTCLILLASCRTRSELHGPCGGLILPRSGSYVFCEVL